MHQHNNHRRKNTERGFTLIELLLSMGIVAALLVLILTVTLQITRIYDKGITLKQVNQSGASIGSDLQSTLKAADAPLSTTSLGSNRLCAGSYSYVWNIKGSTANKYSGGDSGTAIGLVKVSDSDGKMCAGQAVPKSAATELIVGASGNGGVKLQLRDFSITETANAGTNYMYHISYTIATADDATDPLIKATADGDACSGGPGDQFCALNKFDFDIFMRKGGSGKTD